MILVSIVARVRENEIRSRILLERFEKILDLGRVGKKPIPEAEHCDSRASAAVEKETRRAARFPFSFGIAAEHDPTHLDCRIRLEQPEDCSTAANFDVVGMGADEEHPTQSVRSVREG